MRKLLVLVGLALLTGCVAAKQKAFDTAVSQCTAAIPAVIGNYVRRQQCAVDAAREAGFTGPAEDLLDATRMDLAAKVDKGEMTPAEANVQFARLKYDISQQQASQQAANAQAAATILAAMPKPYVLPTPYQIPVAQPWSATCTRMGAFTTCNGN